MGKSVPKMTEQDIQYVIKELEAWRDGARGKSLTWALLEKVSGFSRQTLSNKAGIAEKYEEAKTALSNGLRPRIPKSEDFLSDRITQLEKELARYELLEQQWLERWMRIAYHVRGKGYTIDDFDQPLPPANRK
jgi:hypothetical protein